MKRIKGFNEFINENFFDFGSDFISDFGKIIQNKDLSTHYGDKEEIIQNDGSQAPTIGSGSNLLSISGSYQSPDLSQSSKYSIASRISGITRDPSQIFQIALHYTDGENKRGEDVIKYVFNKGGGHSVHYAIGRDGQLIKGSPHNETVWATNGLNDHSISIEIASGGGVALKDNKWYDGKTQLDESYYPLIVDLGFTFNGYRYYLDYTDGQIKALKDFFDAILKEYPEIKKGISGNVYTKVFGIPEPAEGEEYTSKKLTKDQAKEPGVYIHALAPGSTHIDAFPSSKLVNFLKEYGYSGEVLESKYMYPAKEEIKKSESSWIDSWINDPKGNPLYPHISKDQKGDIYSDKEKYFSYLTKKRRK
jgi:hypothetical protein